MIRFRLFILATLALLIGCQTPDGSGVYRIESIGNAQRSIEAVVMSTRPVRIQANATGAGGNAGGIAGGLIAANNSDNAAVIVAGIIGGIIVGAAIENSAGVYEGTEYVIKTSADVILTVAQINKGNSVYALGDKVILLYGFPCRLIKDRRR